MLEVPLWKKILIISVIIFAIFFSLPNIAPNLAPENAKKINLGLDLRGGAHLLLEVDFSSYILEKTEWLREEVRTILRDKNIGYMNLLNEKNKVKFLLRDENSEENLKAAFSNVTDVTIDVKDDKVEIYFSDYFIKETKKKLLEQSVEIVRRRVDETGTKEPIIQPEGENRIILQVPGIENPESLKRILGKTAKLTFRMLHPTTPYSNDSLKNFIPSGYELLYQDGEESEAAKFAYVVSKKIEISGESLVDARATYTAGEAKVNFKFDAVGAQKFGNITKANINKPFAIILDNKVISAPVIREPIFGGSGVISGSFSIESANELALLLRAGSLPAPLNIIEERTVGPTLGHDSIVAGKKAVVLGILLVIVIMLFIYRLFGLFANLALVLNMLLLVAFLSIFQATLTLPGIAGIALTVGMAVDTNVLIFERIREEARYQKKTIYAVIDNGFSSAFRTILDSNITTLLAAMMLLNFGSGPVKGFAVTLIIGIISSMFSAITFTRSLMILWLKNSKTKAIPFK